MSSMERELELEDERVTERRYAEQLRKDERNKPRPCFFAGTKVPQPPDAVVGRFVGRVALRSPDELLGRRNDFYIGEKHTNVDGVEVYSWSAPIACSFFRENHQHHAHEGLGELCADAVVIRSFRHVNGQIVDFADDILARDAPPHPFPKRGLAIPTAPRRAVPRPTPRPAMPMGASSDQGESDEPTRHEDAEGHRQVIVDGEGIRAESLLRAQLHAPRTKGLRPVLSTLQAEQYELVTVPAMDSMVIEGKPGTGKTIIASHRAAYLVNDQTPPENSLDGKVLVVGPTPEYSRHIRDVIGRLADNRERVIVLSMPELMRQILGAKNDPRGPASNNWQDVEWTPGRLSRSAIGRHRAAHGVTPTVEAVYEYLRMNAATGRPLTLDPEWSRYLRALPPYKEARALRARWPLLAFITWEVTHPVELRKIQHIIVDEAQDVTEMEWFLLQAINEARAWTILGDLNQRRSDHTHASWEKILDVLTVDADTPIRRLKRGYRSTKPILDYANRLLPREQRSIDAFQYGGVAPAVVSTRPKDLGSAVAAEVDRLIANHPTGTAAVISVQPDHVRKALRGAGWVAVSQDLKRWQHNGAEVTVVEPDSARGLEFDAVIVVEPADFPTNYGRQGPLYTALTRGNRELAVVHSKSLPDSLRRK